MTLYVYALVPSTARITGRGAAGERLRLVTVARVAAVVGAAAGRRSATRAGLAAYDAVIRRLASQVTAILPARFNTTVRDEGELTLILRARQSSLRRALAHVRNRVQMTVRVPLGRRPGAPARPASAAAATTGAGYLRARAQAQSVPGVQALRSALTRVVRDERVETRGPVATVYHLIPRGAVERYRRLLGEALRQATDGPPARVLASGPFPPYAFAEAWS